jgi:hypothetical protein
MNRLRIFPIIVLAFALLANAQDKRETGNNRTDPKGEEKSSGSSKDRGEDRTPKPQPPPEVPQTKPVGVTYPPVVPPPPPAAPMFPGPPPVPPDVVIAHRPNPEPDPRRKIFQAELEDCVESPLKAGYDFGAAKVVSCEDSTVDIYLSHAPNDTTYFLVPEDTDIKDIGDRRTIAEIRGFRPRNWSQTHAAPVVAGHVYVIWTYSNDFYLVQVKDVQSDHVSFDWAWHSQLSRKVAEAAVQKALEKKQQEAERDAERKARGPVFGK